MSRTSAGQAGEGKYGPDADGIVSATAGVSATTKHGHDDGEAKAADAAAVKVEVAAPANGTMTIAVTYARPPKKQNMWYKDAGNYIASSRMGQGTAYYAKAAAHNATNNRLANYTKTTRFAGAMGNLNAHTKAFLAEQEATFWPRVQMRAALLLLLAALDRLNTPAITDCAGFDQQEINFWSVAKWGVLIAAGYTMLRDLNNANRVVNTANDELMATRTRPRLSAEQNAEIEPGHPNAMDRTGLARAQDLEAVRYTYSAQAFSTFNFLAGAALCASVPIAAMAKTMLGLDPFLGEDPDYSVPLTAVAVASLLFFVTAKFGETVALDTCEQYSGVDSKKHTVVPLDTNKQKATFYGGLLLAGLAGCVSAYSTIKEIAPALTVAGIWVGVAGILTSTFALHVKHEDWEGFAETQRAIKMAQKLGLPTDKVDPSGHEIKHPNQSFAKRTASELAIVATTFVLGAGFVSAVAAAFSERRVNASIIMGIGMLATGIMYGANLYRASKIYAERDALENIFKEGEADRNRAIDIVTGGDAKAEAPDDGADLGAAHAAAARM